MTVIIGPNNSNKTYIAYSVYGLWQAMMEADLRVSEFPLQRASDGNISIELEALQSAFQTELNDTAADFSSQLESFYQDSSGSLFSRTRYKITMSQQEFRSSVESLSEAPLVVYGIGGIPMSVVESSLILSPPEKTIDTNRDFYTHDTWRFEVSIALNVSLRRHLFGYYYLMPAERNAFVITYKVLANRRFKLILDAQRRLFSSRENSKRQMDLLKEAGEVRYPQPIEDFLELLSEIETETNSSQRRMGELATGH